MDCLLVGRPILGQPLQAGEGRFDLPRHRLARPPGGLPRVRDHRGNARTLGPQPRLVQRHVARLRRVELQAEAEAGGAIVFEYARNEGLVARGEAHRLGMNEPQVRNGFKPLRVTRPWSSRPSACSQSSAVARSPSSSIPVSIPIDSNRFTRSSVHTLPVWPPPYCTFAGWPPTPPNEESKWRTPASYAAT